MGKVEKWPSSIRAELIAIWTVILVTPTRTRVKIKIDLQATIDELNVAKLFSKGSKWLNINNKTLINNITTFIKIKDLDIQLIKVKAHSGIAGNELADDLTKEEANSIDFPLDVNHDSLRNIQYNPTWMSHSIEQKLRKFISNYNHIKQQALWSTNSKIRNYRFGGSDYSINAMMLNIDKTRGANCHNFKAHNKWTRKIKLINNLLPTLDIMKYWGFDIQIDSLRQSILSKEIDIQKRRTR